MRVSQSEPLLASKLSALLRRIAATLASKRRRAENAALPITFASYSAVGDKYVTLGSASALPEGSFDKRSDLRIFR